MAKRTIEQPQHRPAKVRYFELEASDETIQKALATFERMHNPLIEIPRPARRLPSTPAAAEPTLFDNQDAVEAEVSVNEQDTPGPESAGQRRKRGEGDPKDRNAGIEPVGDINFVPKDKTSLKELFAEKSPVSDMDQILVIGHFLQHNTDLPKFGPGHILGGFKHVGEPVPKDLKQTIRNMRKGKAWLKFSDIEDVRLTTEGDNRVEHELGKSSGDSGAK
jgi:hypothetical protein